MRNSYATSGTYSFRFCLAVLIILGAAFAALLAGAANKFCKPGGTGDGSSWSSAGGTSIVNSLGAGDTLWLAGGNYGNGFAITVSGNATSPVVVKRGTASDHGSDTGWQSSYDAQAVFNTGIGVSGQYVTIDGNCWKPPGLPTKFGILVHHASGTKGIDAGGSPGNLTVKNVAVQGPSINGSKAEADGIHFPSNSLISGCEIFDTDALLFAWKGNTGTTIEYCYLYNASSNIVISGNPQDPHPDVIYSGGMFTNGTVRWCVVANVTSEGIFFDQEQPGDNFLVYSCIMFQGDCQTGNTPIQFQNGARFGNVKCYNNTFVDFNKSNVIGPGTTLGSGSATVNNLFINYLPNWPVGVNNNGFSSTGIGTNQIVNSASPFTTTAAYKWVKGSGNPPATRVTTGAPQGYSPVGMEVAFALSDNSWAKGKGILVPAGMNVDLYGNSGNNLGAIQGIAGPGPSPTPPGPTPSPSASVSPSPTAPPVAFHIGDHVITIATSSNGGVTNIRATPGGTLLGSHPTGEPGVIQAGPEDAVLGSASVIWYQVVFGSLPSGWCGEDNLEKTTAPSPSPTATPPSTQTWEKWINKQNDWIRANPPTPDQ